MVPRCGVIRLTSPLMRRKMRFVYEESNQIDWNYRFYGNNRIFIGGVRPGFKM
jgi:hypothetical protein